MRNIFSRNTNYFISRDKWFSGLSQKDVIALFEKALTTLPQYNTIEVVGVQVLKTDSIKIHNALGQVINMARGIGTDKENARLIQESIESFGWDCRHVPPIVEESDLSLYDGFSRQESLLTLGEEDAPYLVVRRKSNYSVEDVIDEVGLGANNHSQSKKHTIVDFKKRFAAFVSRQKELGIEVTTKDGLKWFAGIDNSFGDEQIENAIADTFNASKAEDTMEAFTKREAEKKASEFLGVKKEKIFAYCKRKKSGESHYLKRMIGDVLDYYCDEDNKNLEGPTVVGFLAKTPAEDAEEQRKALINDCTKVNEMMRTIATKYVSDKEFEFINLKGFLPQIIDEETDFIET